MLPNVAVPGLLQVPEPCALRATPPSGDAELPGSAPGLPGSAPGLELPSPGPPQAPSCLSALCGRQPWGQAGALRSQSQSWEELGVWIPCQDPRPFETWACESPALCNHIPEGVPREQRAGSGGEQRDDGGNGAESGSDVTGKPLIGDTEVS